MPVSPGLRATRRRQLEETLAVLDRQLEDAKRRLAEDFEDVELVQDPSGQPFLLPLHAARLTALAALVTLETAP